MLTEKIKNEIFGSKFSRLSVTVQNLYFRMILRADDTGCITADPAELKTSLFPPESGIRAADIERYLTELISVMPSMVRRNQAGQMELFGTAKIRQNQNPSVSSRTRSAHDARVNESNNYNNIYNNNSYNNSHNNSHTKPLSISGDKGINPEEIPFWVAGEIEKITKKHPRFFKPKETRYEATRAICKMVSNGETYEQALSRLSQATGKYADSVKSWPKEDKRYIVSSMNWYANECYLENPESWLRGETPPDDAEMVTLRDGRRIPKTKAVYLFDYDEWVEASGAV